MIWIEFFYSAGVRAGRGAIGRNRVRHRRRPRSGDGDLGWSP